MPITDAIKNKNLLVPVKVVNIKTSEAIPVFLSKEFSSKFNSSFIKVQKNHLSRQIKQQGSFLKGLKAVLIASVVSGMAYGAYRLLKRTGSKVVGSTVEGAKNLIDPRQTRVYKVFTNVANFIREKFASLVDMIKSDFREILGDKLSAVWDAAKGMFGWVKKTFSWWLKFFLIKFGSRWILTNVFKVNQANAKLLTSPIRALLSGKFWKLIFRPLTKWIWSFTKWTYNLLKNVKVLSSWMGTKGITSIKGMFSKLSPKIASIFSTIGKQATSIYSKVFPYILQFTSIFKGGIIASYASKIKNGLSLLAETFNKGNSSLKDKIFGFLKSMKASIIARWVSIKDEEKVMKAQKKIRKKELAEKKAQQEKIERNTRTKAALKAKFKKGIFGNQVGSVGAQSADTSTGGGEGGIGFGDIATLIGSYFGIDYLKGKVGAVAKGGLNLGKQLLTTKGGSALLSGGLAAAQGQGIGGTAGAVGGSFAGQHVGGLIGGGIGFALGGPAGMAAGAFAGELIGGFVGGWIGKNVGNIIEEDLKKGDSPSAGSAENAMYEAIVKANLIQTKDLNKFDDKNRDKYLGIGSDIVGWLNEIWKGVLGKVTTTLGGGNTPQTVSAISGGTPSVPPNASDIIKNPAYAPFIDQAIKATGRTDITPADIARLIQTESNWKPNAISPKGAMGLMQLMPGTAGNINAMDPQQNINRGVEYYAGLLKKYGGDKEKALAAYNWGEGKLDRALGGVNAPMDRSKLPLETKKFLMETYGGPSTVSGGIVPQSAAEGLLAAYQQNKDLKYGGDVYCGSYADMLQKAAIRAGGGDLSKYPDNLGMGMPEALSKAYGSKVHEPGDLSVDFLKSPAMLGASISRLNKEGKAHRETIAQNPSANMEQQILSMGIPGQPAYFTPITESSVQRLKDFQAKVTNVLPMLSGNQIANLERQKNTAVAQNQAANTEALQATASATTSLPGEINKNATQTNNIISQTMNSGGRSQGQQINPFEIDDMYVNGMLGIALSILNP